MYLVFILIAVFSFKPLHKHLDYVAEMAWGKRISRLISVAIIIKYFSWGAVSTPTEHAENEDNFATAASCIDRCRKWEIDFSNFSSRSISERSQMPSLQILKLKDRCVLSNGGVPAMRIVGFFPGILPSTLHELLTDRKHRLKWDFNYRMFDGFVGAQEPPDRVLPKLQRCGGNTGDIPYTAIDVHKGWFTHRVGSTVLRNLGIEGRHFLYFRRSYRLRILSKELSNEFSMFQTIYDGCDQTIEKAMEDVDFRGWVKAHREATTAIHSSMNYQHIALLPVADPDIQIFGQDTPDLLHLSNSGSMFDEETFSKFVSFTADSLSLAKRQGKKEPQGTLCIITSVNDIHVPPSVPNWLQKRIASSLTVKIYETLMKGALHYQSVQT